jgi:hypothetical protein
MLDCNGHHKKALKMDKVGKNTGVGKVREERASNGKVLFNVLLYNYNIDGNLLKPEHIRFIEESVLPVVKAAPLHIKLRGMASKSGSSEYNKQLSLERILRVKKFLTDRGLDESKVPGSQIENAGEELANQSIDDEHDRSVLLQIAVGTKPKPYPKPVVIPPIRPGVIHRLPSSPSTSPTDNSSRSWRIQFLGDISLSATPFGAGLGGMFAGFRLHNSSSDQESLCFLGPFVNAGVGTVGVTLKSEKWTPFNTKNAVNFDFFNAKAEYLSLLAVPHETLAGMLGFLTKTGYTFLSFAEKGVAPITLDTGMAVNVTIAGGTRADFRCLKPQAFDENRYKDYQSLSEVLEANTIPGMLK